MAVTTQDRNRVPDVLRLIRELNSKSLYIGVLGKSGSYMVELAYVHEFGLTITPKNSKTLAIPVKKIARKKSPRDFSDLFFVPSNHGNEVGYLARHTNKAHGIEILFVLMKQVKIPERSFMRESFDANIGKIQKYVDKELFRVLDFELSPNEFYNKLGTFCVSLIKKYMTTLKNPPKSPLTLASNPNKTNPLIDTGRLRASITFRVS